MTKYLIALVVFLGTTNAYGIEFTTDTGRHIKGERVVNIDREYDYTLLSQFKRQLAATQFLPGPLIVMISSNGGSVDVGNIIIGQLELEKSKGVEVVCLVRGKAHSMAFNTLTHCSLRLATPRAMMLVHKVRGYDNNYAPTARNLRRVAEDLDKTDEPFRQANAAAMGLTLEAYDIFADKETYWSAKTLKSKGYLHGLVLIKNKS